MFRHTAVVIDNTEINSTKICTFWVTEFMFMSPTERFVSVGSPSVGLTITDGFKFKCVTISRYIFSSRKRRYSGVSSTLEPTLKLLVSLTTIKASLHVMNPHTIQSNLICRAILCHLKRKKVCFIIDCHTYPCAIFNHGGWLSCISI